MMGRNENDQDGRQERSNAVRDEQKYPAREAVDDDAADQKEDH